MKKEIYLPYFENKKVTVLGLGLLGRGIGDTQFLLENNAEVICTDTRSEDKLAESISIITKKSPKNLKLIIGENRFEDFENKDFILTCAGMPIGYEYLEYARAHNVPVYMSAALVCSIVMKHLPEVVIIGVTGTRGKTTTTELIAHILRENGSRVNLGGNVRGVANLPLLKEIEDGDFLVLELDSWQLQGFSDMRISPHISVFTSFMDDHMNYYKNDREKYFNDKAHIYRNQHEGDILIASEQARDEIIKRDPKISVVVPEDMQLDMKLIGKHNQTAGALAYEVTTQCGLDDESIRSAVATFSAVHGRLEDMGTIRGVRVFNDNNATTGDATVAAIDSICETFNKKPILIVGGTDKGLPIDSLEQAITQKTKQTIYLSGTGTDRVSLSKEFEYEDLKDCVQRAFNIAEDGDIILFSPAFASFSKYFNNEYERNDMFVQYIESVQ